MEFTPKKQMIPSFSNGKYWMQFFFTWDFCFYCLGRQLLKGFGLLVKVYKKNFFSVGGEWNSSYVKELFEESMTWITLCMHGVSCGFFLL